MNAKDIPKILAKREFNVLGNYSTYGRRRDWSDEGRWDNYLVWANDEAAKKDRHGHAYRPLLVVGVDENDNNWYGNLFAQHLLHKKFPREIVKNWLPEPDLKMVIDYGPLGLLKMKMQPEDPNHLKVWDEALSLRKSRF